MQNSSAYEPNDLKKDFAILIKGVQAFLEKYGKEAVFNQHYKFIATEVLRELGLALLARQMGQTTTMWAFIYDPEFSEEDHESELDKSR